MPRSFKLTWQKGTNGRPGRWRKKYGGKTYYFAGGRGKFDGEAYEAAVTAWESQKLVIDTAAPRPNQTKYELAINTWEQALAWSTRHGDREMEALAFEKVKQLRLRLAEPVLEPLALDDKFEAQFQPVLINVSSTVRAEAAEALASRTMVLPPMGKLTSGQRAEIAAEMDGTPLRILGEKWFDRIESIQRRAASPDESLVASIEFFLKAKEQGVETGDVSLGRYVGVRLHVQHFQDWLGRDTNVKEINGDALSRYFSHVLENVKAKTWSRTTAGNYLSTVKSFIRWLWQTERIAALPRIMDAKSKLLNISSSTSQIVVFTKDEIIELVTNASDRTKLYVLLMLNCGMTQKDISDLRQNEVDWELGRITRKRSKTTKHKGVPVVSYLLWPETIRLLRQERDDSTSDRVLANANGSPIWSDSIGEDGKYKKNDNVKNAFERLRTKLEIKKSLKSLKKTSATLLRGNEKYQGLDDLFLGHAPQSMSDKHYTQIPQALLDQAIQWLGAELGLTEAVVAV